MSKLSEAIEARDEAIADRDEVLEELSELESAVAAEHEDHHDGVFRWCERPACRLINRPND